MPRKKTPPLTSIRALTVCQPWAWAIMQTGRSRKDIENRSWTTNYRGPLVIHAGKSQSWMHEDTFAEIEYNDLMPLPDSWDLGYILGVVDLTDSLKASEYESQLPDDNDRSPWADYESACYYWKLENPRPLAKPIPYSGQQGLYTIKEPEILWQVASLLEFPEESPSKPKTQSLFGNHTQSRTRR